MVVAQKGAQTLPCKESNIGTTNNSRVLDVGACTEFDIWQSLCNELPERGFKQDLTPRLTGAGARSAEGTNTGHENAEGMASVGVRVEPTVRLVRGVEGFYDALTDSFGRCILYVNSRLSNFTCNCG